jgi:hypothetical protein
VIDGNGVTSVSYSDYEGRACLLTDALPLGITVFRRGCRAETRSGVTEDVEITLRPGIPVHVQVILEGSPPAPPAFISAYVIPAPNAGGSSLVDRHLEWDEVQCDAAGVAHLTATRPGSHMVGVTLSVESESGSFAGELGGETRIEVLDTAGPQTFHVRITAAQLDEVRSQLETMDLPR